MEYCLPVACLPVGREDREEKSWMHPPVFPAYRQAGIIPVFQKHNINIKALNNSNITNHLMSSSRYIYKK